MAVIEDLFSHYAIDRVISIVREKDYRMGAFYNMMPGQTGVDQVPGRKFGWDRFDVTRLIAQGRTPGSAAAQVDLNPVGTVLATGYRMFEATTLDYERIFRNRGVGRPMGEVDPRGERYISLQMRHKLRRFLAAREFMINRMLVEGGFKLLVTGNDVIPVAFTDATAGAVTIDFQHPASSKLNLTDWNMAGSLIINDLWDVNRESERASRFPIRVAWINSNTAKNIQNNTQVKDTGGTANVWFNELGFTPTQNQLNEQTPGMSFVLRGYPQLQWHVYDDRFETTTGTFIEAVPDDTAIFTPAPSTEWLEYREGSELVQKRENGPIEEQFGFGMWQELVRNPLAVQMFSLDNGLPVPYNPTAWFIADVGA